MPDNNEKERRKRLLDELNKEAAKAFEEGLPMPHERFLELFDHLDEELGEVECDDTQRISKAWLEQHSIPDVDKVLQWLADQGGHCDCEILNNVEDRFS